MPQDQTSASTPNPPSRVTTPEASINPTDDPSPAKRKTYGGFEALTWRDYRKDPNNFLPKCRYAKDLPHSLQDVVNNMSPHMRMMPHMRTLFEGMIRENTLENEPHAPPITLENDVDDDPTPLWTFHYTNDIWHSEGVPPPDVTSLASCDCTGKCNPKSETCACLKKQREAAGDLTSGFAYNKDGKLKISQKPIFECNDKCGCISECQNRVVQHGRKVQVTIKKTRNQGWRVFAGRRQIPKNSFLGIYAGELLTEIEARKRRIMYNKVGETYLVELDFHYLPRGEKFYIDACHAGNFTRFLTYACNGNVELYPCYINEGNVQKPLLAIFSSQDIAAGKEICLSSVGRVKEGGKEGGDESIGEILPSCRQHWRSHGN